MAIDAKHARMVYETADLLHSEQQVESALDTVASDLKRGGCALKLGEMDMQCDKFLLVDGQTYNDVGVEV